MTAMAAAVYVIASARTRLATTAAKAIAKSAKMAENPAIMI